CPIFAATKKKDIVRQFNLEFRVCDAAASPYMALAALIFAGADGIARKLSLPQSGAPAGALPHSLGEALDNMEKSEAISAWLGPVFREAYLRHKRSELQYVKWLNPRELCARYAEVY
ncbi:MAG: glutamine synthetase, partial [Actinomycetota bacterium]